MNFIDHINLYYGTEFKSVPEFIKDLKQGELDQDYNDDSEKLVQLLMFLMRYGENN